MTGSDCYISVKQKKWTSCSRPRSVLRNRDVKPWTTRFADLLAVFTCYWLAGTSFMPQLLSAVFRFLKPQDLFRIRRVSRQFADVVDANGRGWFNRVGGTESDNEERTSMPDSSLERFLGRVKGPISYFEASDYLESTMLSAASMAVLFRRHRGSLVSVDLNKSAARLDLSIFSGWVTEELAEDEVALPLLTDFGISCAPDPRAPPSKHAAELLRPLMNIIYRSANLEFLTLIHVPRHFPFPRTPLENLSRLRISSPIFRPRTFPLFPGNTPHPPAFHVKHNNPSIVGSFPNLKELDLSNCDNAFDADLAYLASCLEHLEVLVQRNGEDGSGLLREMLFYPEIASNLRRIDISNSLSDVMEDDGYDLTRKENLVRMVFESRMERGKLEEIHWGRGRVYRGAEGGH